MLRGLPSKALTKARANKKIEVINQLKNQPYKHLTSKQHNSMSEKLPRGTWVGITRNQMSAEQGVNERKNSIGTAVRAHIPDILNGKYSLADLQKETGFVTLEALQAFLRTNYLTVSIKKIAQTILDNEKLG